MKRSTNLVAGLSNFVASTASLILLTQSVTHGFIIKLTPKVFGEQQHIPQITMNTMSTSKMPSKQSTNQEVSCVLVNSTSL
jgi:hypothetical protein